MQTLAQKLRPTTSQNIALSRNSDYTLREIQCGTCKAVVAAFVTEHPASVDFIWPHKIVCAPEGHFLVRRKEHEDANTMCVGKGATLEEARTFVERHSS